MRTARNRSKRIVAPHDLAVTSKEDALYSAPTLTHVSNPRSCVGLVPRRAEVHRMSRNSRQVSGRRTADVARNNVRTIVAARPRIAENGQSVQG